MSFSKILVIPAPFQQQVYDPILQNSNGIALLDKNQQQQKQLPKMHAEEREREETRAPISTRSCLPDELSDKDNSTGLLFLPSLSPRTTFEASDQCRPVKNYLNISFLLFVIKKVYFPPLSLHLNQ